MIRRPGPSGYELGGFVHHSTEGGWYFSTAQITLTQ